MPEFTRYTQIPGFLVPDSHFVSTRLPTYSTATQAGPRPGVPIPDQETTGVLETSGVSPDENFEVYAQEGGHALSATYLWRHDLSVAEAYRGWDWHHIFHGVTPANILNAVSWDAARDTNGRLFVAYRPLAAGDSCTYTVKVWDQTANAWTAMAASLLVPASASGPIGRHSPALCRLPDGRMLLFALHAVEANAAGYLQISSAELTSTSTTVTLVKQATNALELAWDSTGANPTRYGRMRIAYSWGLLSLVVEKQLSHTHGTAPDAWVLEQWVSDDLGATFRLVEDWGTSVTAATGFARLPDLSVASDGRIVLTYCRDDTADEAVCARVIGSAYESFRAAEEIEITTGIAPTEVSGWEDETGMRVYVAYNAPNASPHRIYSKWATIDDLATWSTWMQGITAQGAATCVFGAYRDVTSSSVGSGLCIRHAADSAWMIGLLCRTDREGVGEWLTIMRLGGWRYPAMPHSQNLRVKGQFSYGYDDWAGWIDQHTLLIGHETGSADLDPDSQGWTLTNTGFTGSVGSLSAAEWNFSGGAGEGIYHIHPTSDVDGGIIVGWEMAIVSAGSVVASNVSVTIGLANGAKELSLIVRYSNTKVVVYDVKAAANVFAPVTFPTTAFHCYTLAVYIDGATAHLKLWAWAEGESLGVLVGSGTASVPASAVATNIVVFGHVGAATDRSRWRWVGYVGSGTNTPTGYLMHEQSNPATGADSTIKDTPGRPILPVPAWLEDGLLLRGTHGPFQHAETWSWKPTYDYPLVALSPRESRSPCEEWRSTDNAEQLFSWLLDGSEYMGISIGVLMHRTNVRSWTFEGRVAAGAWTVLATIDGAYGLTALPYRRDGTELRCSGGTAVSGRYIKKNELVGGYAYLKVGAGSVWRPIVENTEGYWITGFAGYRQPIVRIGGSIAGLDASGTTLVLLPPSHLAVISRRAATTLYDQFAIRITAGASYEGYWRIGSLPVGPMAYPGQRNSFGRIIGDAPRYELAEAPSGRRWCLRAGSNRRTAEIGWTDPIDLLELSSPTSTTPPTVISIGGTGYPSATYRDVPYLMRGLLDAVQGARYPLVYCPRVLTASATQTTNDPEDFLYGSVTSALSRTSQRGLERTSEIVTVDSVTIEEEA